MKLAVLDYGIGGIGIYQMLQKHYPGADFLYFSDSGVLPYGKMKQEELNRRVAHIICLAAKEGADQLIIACHSASTALDFIDPEIPVLGMQQATCDAISLENGKTVAIIGGGRTVEHGFYRDQLSARGFAVKQANAQELSILVEAGKVSEADVAPVLNTILAPLLPFDQLVLACTHYPVLIPHIARFLPGNTRIIDPALQLLQKLPPAAIPGRKSGKSTNWFCSGDKMLMAKAARLAWQESIMVDQIQHYS